MELILLSRTGFSCHCKVQPRESSVAAYHQLHTFMKLIPSTLQLDYMKLESLVIANQNVAVNTFPGLVHTARHTMGVSNARSQ